MAALVEEEELSVCDLSRCSLSLVSSEGGLWLRWRPNTQGRHTGDEQIATTLITTDQCHGKLYPVLLEPVLETAVFGRELTVEPKTSRSKGANNLASCALVACDNGLVAGAHWRAPGTSINICHTIQSVMWAGVLMVEGSSHSSHQGTSNASSAVLAVVDKGGTLSIGIRDPNTPLLRIATEGKQSQSYLCWHITSLPAAPIALSARKDRLLFSDGDNSWLGILNTTKGNSIGAQWRKLGIRGVVKIESVGRDQVGLFTCDGRKYKCHWDELKPQGDEAKSGKKESPGSMDSIRTGIHRCSKLLCNEGKEIASLDIYIKQLSLVQRLVHESETAIFSPTVKLERSLENRGAYCIIVRLQKVRNDIELDGKWWRLLVVTPKAEESKYFTLKLDQESLKSEMCLTLPFPAPDAGYSPHGTTLRVYLILEHPISATPVCQIYACSFIIDTIDFLTHSRALDATNLSLQSSILDFHETSKNSKFPSSTTAEDKVKLPVPCKVSLSLKTSDGVLHLLNTALLDKPLDNQNQDTEHKSTLYHREGKIDISCRVKGEITLITLEGANPSLVLSVRGALERRASEVEQNPRQVTLSSTVLYRAQHAQKVFRMEANDATSVAAIAHLHNVTSNLLSLLPIA